MTPDDRAALVFRIATACSIRWENAEAILAIIEPVIRTDERRQVVEEVARLANDAGNERLDQAHAPLVSGEALHDRVLAEVCNAHAESGYTLIRFGEAIRAALSPDPPSNL